MIKILVHIFFPFLNFTTHTVAIKSKSVPWFGSTYRLVKKGQSMQKGPVS